MEINAENMSFAAEFIGLFREYRDFPQNPETFKLHCEHLLKVVHRKKIVDIYHSNRAKDRLPDLDLTSDEWRQKMRDARWDQDTLDTDWLRERLMEECDRYPLPPVIRRRYQKICTPADGWRIQDGTE